MTSIKIDSEFMSIYNRVIELMFQDDPTPFQIGRFLPQNIHELILSMLKYELSLYSNMGYHTIPLDDVEEPYEVVTSLTRYMFLSLYPYSHIFSLWDIEVGQKYAMTIKPNRKSNITKNDTTVYGKTETETNTDTSIRTFNSGTNNSVTENGMGEISPITATIGEITTPNSKTIDTSTSNETYNSGSNNTSSKSKNVVDGGTDSFNMTHEEDTYNIEYIRIQYQLADKYNISEIIKNTVRKIIREFNCYI